MEVEEISLGGPEYALLLRGHAWIRSVDPYASLSRGWAAIVADLLDAIDVVMEGIAEGSPEVHAVDFTTKAKLGQLRVSFRLAGLRTPPEEAWRLLGAVVERAEASSARACEACGAPGRARVIDDWLICLCDAHVAELT